MNPDNARPIRITAAAGTYLAGASSAGTLEKCSPLKAVYDADAFVPHAALLRQGCPHCAKFPTAASRRSLGRISVPMWPVGLSTRLPVVGTVGLCPAVYLMGRDPIPAAGAFPDAACATIQVLIPLSGAVPGRGQVGHVLLTRSPLHVARGGFIVRLACVRHAASVHPEPGSNSPLKKSGMVGPSRDLDIKRKRNCKSGAARTVASSLHWLHWLN